MEKRVRALNVPLYIKAHVACIVWWDLSLHDYSLKAWCLDLRNAYNPNVKEDLTRLEQALIEIGWPQAKAHERAFKDVCGDKTRATERKVDPEYLLPGAARKKRHHAKERPDSADVRPGGAVQLPDGPEYPPGQPKPQRAP